MFHADKTEIFSREDWAPWLTQEYIDTVGEIPEPAAMEQWLDVIEDAMEQLPAEIEDAAKRSPEIDLPEGALVALTTDWTMEEGAEPTIFAKKVTREDGSVGYDRFKLDKLGFLH